MAHLERFGSYVILALTPKEKFFGLHSSPQAKYSEIISVRKVEKTWSTRVVKGVHAPGIGLPWVMALGTWRYFRGKNFVAVYRKNPCYVITFNSGEFKQWVVTPDNSEEEMQKMFPVFLTKV